MTQIGGRVCCIREYEDLFDGEVIIWGRYCEGMEEVKELPRTSN